MGNPLPLVYTPFKAMHKLGEGKNWIFFHPARRRAPSSYYSTVYCTNRQGTLAQGRTKGKSAGKVESVTFL